MEARRTGRFTAEQTRRATRATGTQSILSESGPQGHSFRAWLRQAVTQEKGRAGVRDLLRDATQTAKAESRRSSAASSVRRSVSLYSEEAFDVSSEESDEALGPYDAGDPSAEMDRHHCELPSDIEQEPCPPLPVHPNMIQVMQKIILPYIIIWENHPRCKEILRSTASIRREQKRHARSRHWYMVHPMCIMRIWWEPFVALIMLLSLFIEPLDEAFRYSEEKSTWSTVIFFLRFICILDCLMNFFTGYYIAHENTTVLQPRLIARRYLRSFFLLDILATINISWIFSTPSYDLTPLLIMIDFIRLLRLRTVHSNLSNFMVIFGYSPELANSILLLLKFIALIHCLSMINWYTLRVCCSKRDLDEMIKPECNNSWITLAHLWDNPTLLKYIHCVHRTTVLLLRTNMPQGPPHTGIDTCVVILNSIVGAVAVIYLFVNSIFLALSKQYTQIIYEQIMVVVRDYADFKKLTPELKERLLIFYEYTFARTSFNEPIIRNNLSKSLRYQVKQHSYRESVRLSGLFRGLPREVCTAVVQHLSPIVLMRGDVFIRQGDPCDSMYFVQNGGLAIVTVTGLESEHLQDGDFFGEDGLLQPHGLHSATVVALETSVVLKLPRRDFNRVLETFPPLARRIRRCSQRRQEVLRMAAVQEAQDSLSSEGEDEDDEEHEDDKSRMSTIDD